MNCSISFKCPDLLTYHQRCHGADNNIIICPDCSSPTSETFSSWNTLHTHLWRVHSVDMELYSCTQCNFKTPVRSRLVNTHQRIHSNERNFKCVRCDKAFKNSKQLTNHNRVHAAADSTTIHRCSDCDQIFYKHRHLRSHMRTVHESADKLSCGICGVMCSSVGARRTHMSNHEPASTKRYQCEDCVYGSNDQNAFRRHRKTHGDALPYRCPHCDYGCIQSTTFAVSALIIYKSTVSYMISMRA